MTGPRRRVVLGAAAAFTATLLASCRDEGGNGRSDPAPPQTTLFADVTDSAGIEFVHRHGGSGRKYLVETNGSGAAWLDADGDGALDLYLVQGAPLPGWQGEQELRNRLLLQREGRFVDVTDSAGVGDTGHGMAAAAPDADGDGDPDLFVTNHGRNVFYRNDGAARFEDETGRAGLGEREAYDSACLFADFDRDGDLDLYLVGYLDWSLEKNPDCGLLDRGEQYRSYCHPDMFHGIDDLVFRNDGDAAFTDVSEAAGVEGSNGKGLGATTADVDADGDLDVFVANDSNENLLWSNEGELRFVDRASEWSVAFNGDGSTEACMGCDFADVDGDLDFDLFTVNLSGETNTLWLWEGRSFRDRSFVSGLGGPSESFVGFGTVLADLDLDGWLDVAVANGHVLDNAELFDRTQTHAQLAHLFRGAESGRFTPMDPAAAGPFFAEPIVGRSLAMADYDDDGDLDLLFTVNGGAPHLLRSKASQDHRWVGFRLAGRRSDREAVGARVIVDDGARRRLGRVRAGGSYLAFHDRRVLFGLGTRGEPVDVEVHWPRGGVQRWDDLAPGQYHSLVESAD